MAGLPERGIRGPLGGCSGWIRCMSFGTKCWWRAGRSGRWRGSWGLSRVTVRKYLDAGGAGAESGGGAAAAAGLGRGARAGGGAAGRVGAVDRRQAAADGHAAARVAGGRGPPRRRHGRQGGGRRVEAAAPRGLRAADVSAGRSRRGRLLRGAGRRRRDPPQGVALPDAADVLGPRLRLDLRAAGSDQLSRRARARVRALRRRAGARRVRQSAGGGRADPGRRRAHADAAVRRARLALPARGRASVGPARATTKAASRRAARPSASRRWSRFRAGRRSRRSMRRCSRSMDARLDTTRDAAGQTIGAASPRSSASFGSVPTPFVAGGDDAGHGHAARAGRGSRARCTRCRTRWAGLDLVVRIGATTVTIVGRDGTRMHASAPALWRAVDRLPALPAGARAQAAGGAPGAAGSAARSRRAVSGGLGSAPRGARAARGGAALRQGPRPARHARRRRRRAGADAPRSRAGRRCCSR